MTLDALSASFRDPAGYLFESGGRLYRKINVSYLEHYRQLMQSGLYARLVDEGLLVPHVEAPHVETAAPTDPAGLIIEPERIPYISYPFEWCFSQLQDAALCTIRIQQIALEFGMVLKDASAYNVQFHQGRAVFIDTLSFETYRQGRPWVAYRQFCQHFLAPLALMAHRDIRLAQLFRVYLDGLPLDLVSTLLPLKTWFNYSLLSHLHLHARSQSRYANLAASDEALTSLKIRPIGALAFKALMGSIESAVRGLRWQLATTEWGAYYQDTNYQDRAMQHKEALVKDFIAALPVLPTIVHDLGANDGRFSRIAASLGVRVVAQDIDPVAVEKNYLLCRQQQETRILPLVQDLTNPSADLGWLLRERDSLFRRTGDGLCLALALVHHLAIANNVPLPNVAEFFAKVCSYLIIEFVPKEDSQVKRLLATREDVFPDYHLAGFEAAFASCFTTHKRVAISDSSRTLFLMERLIS
ncbi:MAG: hypothetical protein RQ899_07980 [Pseudomonadales bacterium]|nr:hypothetical protein [Pseudomonadales bacterium]